VLNSASTYAYADSFAAEIPAGETRSPEQWARAVFEGAPLPLRWLLVVGFRFGLGLRLGPRSSPDHVLGWRIVATEPDSVTLEARSWCLTSRLVFDVGESRLTQSTYVSYDRRIAAVLWPPVAIVHRRIVPRLVRHAASARE
jgi:hypothetical protein